jgi:hypothetical protein
MTTTRKRVMTVALSSGVAALGATGACPPATAAASAKAPPPAPHRANSRPRPAAHRGPYLYQATIGGEVKITGSDMFCSGSAIRFVGLNVVAEGARATALWERTPSAWSRRFTFAAGPATTISVPWSSQQEKREAEEHEGKVSDPKGVWATASASRVCSATTENAGLASVGEGVVTWRLPKPVASVAALLAQPPANVALNELIMSFHIEPDGNVPPFNPNS